MLLWQISACRGGSPILYGPYDHPSCHGHGDDDGVPHDHDDPCGPYDLHHNDVYRDGPYDRGVSHDVHVHGVLPSCGHRHVFRDGDDDRHAYDVCLPYDGHRKSDGPCEIRPCGTSYGNHRFSLPYHDASYDHAFHPYGDARAHGGDHDDHAYPSAFCGHLRGRGDALHDDVFRGRHVHLCDDDDDLCGLCVLSLRVRDGDEHGAPYHHLIHGDDSFRWQLPPGLSPPPPTSWRRPPQDTATLLLTTTSC